MVVLHDRIRDRQPQPRTPVRLLGREKRLEDPLPVRLLHPDAVILHPGDHPPGVVCFAPRPDGYALLKRAASAGLLPCPFIQGVPGIVPADS